MGSGSGIDSDIRLNTVLSEEDRRRYQDSRRIQGILKGARRLVVYGMSSERTKASHMVASYLRDEGYEVVPVNPRATEIDGMQCYPDLASVQGTIDGVVVFRPSAEVAGIVDQAIAVGAGGVWMQLRIVDLEAAERAQAAGLWVVVDRCIKMEHGRYAGALHWAGMNTEVISARRRDADF